MNALVLSGPEIDNGAEYEIRKSHTLLLYQSALTALARSNNLLRDLDQRSPARIDRARGVVKSRGLVRCGFAQESGAREPRGKGASRSPT